MLNVPSDTYFFFNKDRYVHIFIFCLNITLRFCFCSFFNYWTSLYINLFDKYCLTSRFAIIIRWILVDWFDKIRCVIIVGSEYYIRYPKCGYGRMFSSLIAGEIKGELSKRPDVINLKLIIELTRYSTDILICRIILSSPWTSKFSRIYIPPK